MIEKDIILASAYHASSFINSIDNLDNECQVACIRAFLNALKLLNPDATITAVKEWEDEHE